MSDEQLDNLKSLELVYLRITGFSLAIGFSGQIPIKMQDTPPSPFAARGKKKKKLSTTVAITTNPKACPTAVSGSLGMSWER